jgi:hypothetical protein
MRELEATLALQQAMELFERRMEGLCEDMEVAADASVGKYVTIGYWRLSNEIFIVMGRVMEQWPQIFKILSLICALSAFECSTIYGLIVILSGITTGSRGKDR